MRATTHPGGQSLVDEGMIYDESRISHRRHGTGRRLSIGLLLSKGYIVHGIKRRSSSFNSARIDHMYRTRTRPMRVFRFTTET